MLRWSCVVLTAIVLLVAAAGCSGGPDAPVTVTETVEQEPTGTVTEPTTTTDAETTATPEIVPPVTLFSSPTGNIGCAIDKDYARCDIATKDWEAPADPSCELEHGDAIEVSGDGEAQFVCHGDTTRGSDDVLDYGDSIQATGSGRVICSSAESGITCKSTDSGHGFSISRQSYDTF